MDKKIIVVLGMHRSGTSAIARGIIELGAFPGNHLMKEQEDNPKGFWEDERIAALNDAILSEYDLKWYSIDNPTINRFSTLLQSFEENYFQKALDIVNDILSLSKKIVVKDPRINITLPFWDKVFKTVDAEVKYIVAFRDPLETAKSLHKRNDMDIQYGLKLWLYYNSMILKNIKSEFLVCSFSLLMENPVKQLNRISEFIGCFDENQAFDEYCNNFLDTTLKHHNEDILTHSQQNEDYNILRSIYTSLQKWSELGNVSYQEANHLFINHHKTILFSLGYQTSVKKYDYCEILATDKDAKVTNLYKKSLNETTNLITISFNEVQSLEEIHFNPSNYACLVKVNFIRFETKDGKIHGIKSINGNYGFSYGSLYFFDTEKPQLIIESQVSFSTIKIDFELFYLDSSSYYFVSNLKNKLLLDKSEEIEKLVAENKTLIQEVEEYTEIINRKDEEIKKFTNLIIGLEKNLERKRKLIDAKNDGIIEIIEERNEEILQSVNNWIRGLERELEERQKVIDEKNEEVENLRSWGSSLHEENESNKNYIQKKNDEIEELSQWGKKLDQEVADLRSQLGTIYNSRGWRLLLKFYKVKGFFVPDNSKRKLFYEIMVFIFRHPLTSIKSFSFRNAKLLLQKMKTDSPTELMSKIKRNSSIYLNNSVVEKYDVEEVAASIEKKLVIPTFENIDVSIVIPAYNQFKYNMDCINAIIKNTEDVEYEVIFIDDASTDETTRIEEYVENIRVIRNKENYGFLLNCNNGARIARGKYILFLNNDTQVQKDWLKPLIDLIESDEKVGMVGSKLVYPDGKLQEAGGIIWSDASGWNYGRLDDPHKSDFNYVKEVDYISGASIMIKKSLWTEIGGFDIRYVPAYYEDTDLAFEVRKKGYKVMYQPKSVVVHFEGVSNGTDTNEGLKSYQVKNKDKFIEKWSNVLETEHFENAKHVFWARDRSETKKTILVIDHYVSHYDKDAGSRFTFHYLKLFSEMGYHVIFLGDNFFKHEPYATQIEQLGIQVLYGNWYANNIKNWIKENGEYFDYVYLNRPHISVKYIDLIKNATMAKVIYFGHDLHYLRELRNYEIDGNEELLKSSKQWKKLEFELFEKADVIHVVSSYEKEILTKELPEKVIRHVPLYIYDDSNNQKAVKQYENRKGILFVGGFNHKPNIDAVKWFVQNVFPDILSSEPDIVLTIVGSNPTDEVNNLQSENIKVTGFVSDEELGNYYNDSRIVIVPLRYGAGVKGKVVEALYYQIPIVSTSIGAEGLTDIDQYLLKADSEKEFSRKVIELYNDSTLWNTISRKSKEYIQNNFSTKAAKDVLLLDVNPMKEKKG